MIPKTTHEWCVQVSLPLTTGLSMDIWYTSLEDVRALKRSASLSQVTIVAKYTKVEKVDA